MPKFLIALAAAAGLMATHAAAADKPAMGPAPSWVKPVGVPAEPARAPEGAVGILLSDQQLDLEPGRSTVYSDVALKIRTAQGLQAGSISFAWRPDTDEPIVHKLVIHRGGQTIDVLGSGQTFTVVRREPNLESATLDGVLTANIQPEGLQVGDVLEFAMSIRSSDPVLKGHIEQVAGAWNGVPVQRAHLHVQWPSSLALRFRETTGLPPLAPVAGPGGNSVDLSLDDVQPVIPPKGAPIRYGIGRMIEVTDFKSWSEVGALMAPLFAKASVVPAQGPLRIELDRIRALSADPKVRAQAALTLVQERVRYVALVMGQGGLVPADAETTWARRFGDCKAKTALLLGLLHELGIQADAVVVNTVAGDAIDGRLPMIDLFDHVLVRATIAGRTYWLDGTRPGDADIDRLTTPNYGWGLPLVPTGAALVRMLPPPLDAPTQVLTIHLDASAGISLPAPAHVELSFSRDEALGVHLSLSNLDAAARDRAMRSLWRSQFDFIDVNSIGADFDAKTGEERLTMDGVAHMDWSSGYYAADGMAVGFKPDFVREAGSDQEAPYAVAYPHFERTTETIVLPPGFGLKPELVKSDLDETVAGMEYHRHVKVQGDSIVLEKSERSLAPEFPAREAAAAADTLRRLEDKTIAIYKPASYRPTARELEGSLAKTPTTAAEFVARGSQWLSRNRLDDAIADFTRAIELDPKNVLALSGRATALSARADYAAATRDLDAASAIDPKNLVMLKTRGLMASRRGEFADAIAIYDQVLAASPTDVFALSNRAKAEYATGQFDAVLRDAAAALKNDPRLVEMHGLRIDVLQRQGRTQDTLAETAALAAMTTDGYAQVVAGNAYHRLGKPSEAAAAYERALKIKPEAYIYLDRARFRPKSDVAGRRADLDAALALDPKSVGAINDKAAMLEDQGDAPGAIALYSKGLQADPTDINLLTGRGIAYAKAGDKVHADTDFDAARPRATQPEQLNAMCWVKATAGVALDSALADCEAALAKAPGTAAYLDSRAFVMLRLGRLDQAIADYTTAIHKAPLQADSIYGRGVAWTRKGDRTQGAADMAVALKMDPEVGKRFEAYGVNP